MNNLFMSFTSSNMKRSCSILKKKREKINKNKQFVSKILNIWFCLHKNKTLFLIFEGSNKKRKKTCSARSTFGFPFSNKNRTICSYPFSAATKRGVVPSFWQKKIENEKKNEKMKIKKKSTLQRKSKKPYLEDQHLLFLFPIKFEQFVHVLLQQQ